MRVFDFTMEGMEHPIKLSSMSARAAREHIEEGQELLKRNDVGNDEWLTRRNRVLDAALAETFHPLEDYFDSEQLNEMYQFVLRKSGLRTIQPGEATAVLTLPRSTAA